jgi:hypothetical protein
MEGIMPNREIFDELRMANEAEYFHKKEQELIERLSRRAQREAEREEMAEVIGIADEEILRTLQELGYTRETVGLLHLVPLAQVAWSSGSVTPQERDLALRLSEWRGVKRGSPAWEQLNLWLDERPTDEFFLTTLRIIRHILDSDTGKPCVASRTDLISFCIRIAMASGGFLGVGSKISEGEQMALDQIVEELTRRNPEAVRRMVEEVEGPEAIC